MRAKKPKTVQIAFRAPEDIVLKLEAIAADLTRLYKFPVNRSQAIIHLLDKAMESMDGEP